MLFANALLALAGAADVAVAMPLNFRRVSVPQEHFEVMSMRASMELDPSAVIGTECLDPRVNIVFHDQNAAELAICGGIGGSSSSSSSSPSAQACGAGSSPASWSTTGKSGSARFTLAAVGGGEATISLSRERWERCVRAARAVCPTGSLRATCVGGATAGDVLFTLDSPRSSSYLGELR